MMRALSSQLYGVKPADPLVLVLTGAALFLAGILATLVPASRAARIDPTEALRAE
jgi:ABC-type lipoprotein release transport system permease subunit